MNIFERARSLNFPLGQYVVVGSGPMEAVGIRQADDLDIAVTKEFFESLRTTGAWREEERYGKIFLEGDRVTILPSLEWESYTTTAEEAIGTATIIDGIPFLNFDELKKFKRAMGREKDLKDIELINTYLENEARN